MLLVHSLQGVNRKAIEHIVSDQWLPVDEILKCIKDEEVAPTVRSDYLEFATAAIVELQLEESGAPSDHVWRAFVSS